MNTYKLSDLYEMSSGISSKPEQAGHGSPFVSFSTVFNNPFLPDELPDLMDTSDKEKETYSIKAGDIFLTRTSETLDELGMSCVAVKDYKKASYSGFLKRLRPKQKNITYPKFMAFYLRGYLFRKTMNNNAIMTLRASLNEQIFSYLDLILPSFEEQVKIGDFFYAINQKTEINNKINQELEAMAKTLYDYWFVQFDFPDPAASFGQAEKPYKSSGGKMIFNEDLKRAIPVGWKVEIIDNVLAKNTRTKKIPSSEYLGKGKIPIVDQSTKFICGYTNDDESVIEAIQPRIVFGDHTRIVKFINFNFAKGADGTQILLSNNERMPQHLFYYSILKIDLSNYGYARHFKFLKDTKIIIPNLELANKFEKQIKVNSDKIKHNIFENQKLSELTDWLLPILMNGQITVSDAEKQIESLGLEERLPPKN
jgi:type I restriction enzyme S subunit